MKQKALWQALDPNTFLGKFFSHKRGSFEPNINRGRLKKIRIELQKIVATNELIIDSEVKKNIYHDVQIIRYFPQLVSKYPICSVQQTVVDVTPASIASDKWYKNVYGKFLGNHKANACSQICSISNLELRQRALWQALDPNTYLGKIFHTQRGFFKPAYDAGALQIICGTLTVLLQTNQLVIDTSVKHSLLRQPYIASRFPLLKNAQQLPAGHDELKPEEHKNDDPPPYSFESNPVSHSVQTSPLSSTALMMQAGNFIPQSASADVTPGAHLLVPVNEVKDLPPSAPALKEVDAASSNDNVPPNVTMSLPLNSTTTSEAIPASIPDQPAVTTPPSRRMVTV